VYWLLTPFAVVHVWFVLPQVYTFILAVTHCTAVFSILLKLLTVSFGFLFSAHDVMVYSFLSLYTRMMLTLRQF